VQKNNRNSLTLSLPLVGLLCASVPLWFCPNVSAADWPQWRGPAGDGTSPETNWSSAWDSPPPIAWRRKIGLGFASVAVADGRVYAIGNEYRSDRGSYYDTLYCLDARTGETIWEHSYPCRLVNRLHEGGPSSSPTVHDGRVYVLSKVGQVLCLDAASGSVQWEADLTSLLEMQVPEWGFCSSPLIEGDKVIFQAGATVALHRATGEVIWRSPTRQAAYTTPAPFDHGGQRLLAVLTSEGLSIVDAADGRELGFEEWRTQYDTNATTPLVIGDTIFLSTGYNKGCALLKVNAGGGLSILYRNAQRGSTMSNHFNNAVLVDGFLYGFDGNSHNARSVELVCMELATGTVRWRHRGLGVGSLIAAAGKLIVLSDDGRLVIAQATPDGYKPLTDEVQILGGKCWTSPVISNGRLYARNARGDLVCVDLRGP
jgi:outer membrane protein assembly factor BamB